jgi:hypothetical protein
MSKLVCLRCNKIFETKFNFQRHKNRKNQCLKITPKNNEITLKNNENINSINNNLTCNYCSKVFCRKDVLKKHFNRCKKKKQKDEEKEIILKQSTEKDKIINKLLEEEKHDPVVLEKLLAKDIIIHELLKQNKILSERIEKMNNKYSTKIETKISNDVTDDLEVIDFEKYCNYKNMKNPLKNKIINTPDKLNCKHDILKKTCKECNSKDMCKSKWCYSSRNSKYEGYCKYCHVNLFPEKNISKNYKSKEKDVGDRIIKKFSDLTWVCDKKIEFGCSLRRPDLFCDYGSHIIIIEIDENAHSSYDCSCDNKRLMQLSEDVKHKPIVFIRFNPDDYVNKNGEKIKSCWKINQNTGVIVIEPNKKKEWDERINTLEEQVQYWINNKTEKTIEIIELYYDQHNKENNQKLF